MSRPSIAIVGAGLCGLSIANYIHADADVTLFEKSRGLGGRLATRYAGSYQFDHGAQFFTAKSDRFKSFLAPLIQKGVIGQWDARFVELNRHEIMASRQWGADYSHYVAMPKMNQLGKYLAEGLHIHRGYRVESMKRANDGWCLMDENGQALGRYDWVISTAPAQQSAALMPEQFVHYEHLEQAKLLGCYATMLGFKEPLALAWDAALVHESDVSWISVNSSKPGRAETGFSLVAHATNNWAEKHMEADSQQVQTHLLAEISQVIGYDVRAADHIAVHRWRYANADKQQGKPALIDMHNHLIACGDWCIQGRVEAAFLSGHYVADELKKQWK